MKILILRHAESVGNATGDYSTEVADSLSQKGLAEATGLVDDLAGWTFDKIVVSPLLRTLQTIAPYLQTSGRLGELWPELTEACWQDEREEMADEWRSRPASLSEEMQRLFTFRDEQAIRPAHPESFGEGLRRVNIVADRLEEMAERSDGTILVVTHGHMIRELLNLFLEPPAREEFHHDNRCASLVEIASRPRLEFTNKNPKECGA